MDSFLTIVNPAAGGGRAGRNVGDALERLRRAGLELDVRETARAGHARELAREARSKGQKRFIAVGGDGTSFEVVDGIFAAKAPNGDPPTLGLLPLGTGNSFLRDFSIDSTDLVIEALARGRERECDVVRAVHRDGTLHYINLLSIGFSARAGALTNDRFKPLGMAGYVLAVLTCVARLEHPVFPMRLDGGDLDRRPAALLSFSNSKFTGGTMMMAPAADVADGELDVIRVGELGRLRFVRAFPAIFKGTHVDLDDVEQTRARKVELDGIGPVPCMVDGEVLELDLRSLEVLPGALRVIA